VPKIDGSVSEYIKVNSDTAEQSRLLDPLPISLVQHGQTCKIYSLSTVMNWHFMNGTDKLPPPARKRDRGTLGDSLRKQAKNLGSQIGEIYDYRILLELARNNGFFNSEFIDCSTDTYLQQIKNQIDLGNPVITFYDANNVTGDPLQLNSQREHSTVIAGYFTNLEGRLCFIALQWGAYYYLDAFTLMASANQLADEREPETFYKISKDWRQKGDRRDNDDGLNLAISTKSYSRMVVGKKPELASSFRNKILVIGASRKKSVKNNQALDLVHPTNSLQSEPRMSDTVPAIYEKFILLEELVNFIEIDVIRPDPYPDSRLQEFADHFAIQDEIIELTQKKYQTQIDGTLEDDIYKQNPNRNRSITEAISNAIDSQSHIITVNIKDGEYTVNDFGISITPKSLFRSLLLTKATSKEDGDNIGRFGLGFYTSLAHLDTINNFVNLDIKAQGYPAYHLEFRKILGKIRVFISPSSRIAVGTSLTVQADDIVQAEYEDAAKANIEYHSKTPIYINGTLANVVAKEHSHRVSNTNIILLRDTNLNCGVITIGGVTIQRYTDVFARNTMLVAWDLPKLATLSESRDQVQIDEESMRQEIRQLIDFGCQLSDELQPPYFNTIAPMVKNLQDNNTSLSTEDNLLGYLRKVVADIFHNQLQVPDLKHLAPLHVAGTQSLNPLIIDSEWQMKVAFRPAQRYVDSTKLLVAPMNVSENHIGFIHDRDTKTVYVNKEDYLTLTAKSALNVVFNSWKLKRIMQYPTNEIQLSLINDFDIHLGSSKERTLEPFKYFGVRPAFNELYSKHGMLSELGDTFVSNLSRGTRETLQDAVTLIKAYPVQPIILYGRLTYTEFKKLKPYTYHGKIFYLFKPLNGDANLLNHAFQPLFHFKARLLLEKIKQMQKRGEENCEVFLTEDDRLPVENAIYKIYEVFNGMGTLIKSTSTEVYYSVLDKNYYTVSTHGEKEANIYHFRTGFISKYMFDKYGAYSINPYGLVLYKSSYGEVSSGFDIFDLDGKHLCTYSAKGCRILHADCQLIESKLYITFLQSNKKTSLLIANVNANTPVTEFKHFSHENILGFPATGYIDHNTNNEIFYRSINIEQNSFKIKNCQQYSNVVRLQEKPKKIYCTFNDSANRLNDEKLARKLFLVSYEDSNGIFKKIIIDDYGHLVPVPDQLREESFINIAPSWECFQLTKEKLDKTIIDRDGNILAHGETIEHITTKDYNFFHVNEDELINSNNQVLASGIKYVLPLPIANLMIIAYKESTASEQNMDLLDYQGKSIIGQRCYIIYTPAFENDKNPYVNIYREKDGKNTEYFVGQHVIIPDSKSPHPTCENLIVQYNIVYNNHGYPLFPGELKNAINAGSGAICDFDRNAKSNIFIPLTRSELQSTGILKNISYLNTFNLNPFEYASCLRFVDLSNENFKYIYPYMQLLTYTPTHNQSDHYATVFKALKEDLKGDKWIIARAIDLVYGIAGSYSTLDMAKTIYDIMKAYGVDLVKRFYEELRENENKLKFALHGVEGERDILNEFSQEIGQLMYFIFFPNDHLIETKPEILLHKNMATAEKISMLDFLTAIRLDKNITRFANDKQLFITAINQLSKNAHKHHLERKLNHALYHQAHPRKAFYLREFLQNAMDASSMDESRKKIPFYIFQTTSDETVLSLEDNGTGMTKKGVFEDLLPIGMSTKRNAEKGKFIGGRGVGFYTAFPNSKRVQFKTGIGDGETHYFVLIPCLITLPNGKERIIDIDIYWETVTENFRGTSMQRVSRESIPALQAAKYQRAISTHAKFIDGNSFAVTLNGFDINKPMQTLMQLQLPEIGLVKFFISNDRAITVGGLYLKPLPENFFAGLPAFISKLITLLGLVVDLPKNVALNRERNDFESTENFTAFLIPYIKYSCYAVYISFFTQAKTSLEYLPYDFFERFQTQKSQLIGRNPNVITDAATLNNYGTLKNYTVYEDPQILTDLLCFLKLIPFELINGYGCKMFSLVELATLYNEGQIGKDAQMRLPLEIINQIDRSQTANSKQEWFKNDIQAIEQSLQQENKELQKSDYRIFNKEWVPKSYAKAPHWELFIWLSSQVITALYEKGNICFGFSTIDGSALAYTYHGKNIIYWNPLSVAREPEFKAVFDTEVANPFVFIELLYHLSHILSHELVHLADGPCTGTHNLGFELRQRDDILIKRIKLIPAQKLYNHYLDFFEKHSLKGKEAKKGISFILSQWNQGFLNNAADGHENKDGNGNVEEAGMVSDDHSINAIDTLMTNEVPSKRRNSLPFFDTSHKHVKKEPDTQEYDSGIALAPN
jgi:hypothetical protein